MYTSTIMESSILDLDPELLLLIVKKLDVRAQGHVAACCKLFGLLVVETCCTTPFLASAVAGADVDVMIKRLWPQLAAPPSMGVLLGEDVSSKSLQAFTRRLPKGLELAGAHVQVYKG